MNALYKSLLETTDVLALLREFTEEARSFLAHMEQIEADCMADADMALEA